MPLPTDLIKALQAAAKKGTSAGAAFYGNRPMPPRVMRQPAVPPPNIPGSNIPGFNPGAQINNKFGPPQSQAFPAGLGAGRPTNTPWGPGVQARPALGGGPAPGAGGGPEDPLVAIRRALGQNGLPPGRANLGGGGGMPGGGGLPPGRPPPGGLPVPSPGGGLPIPPTMPRGPLPSGRPMPPWMGVPAAGAAMIGGHALMGGKDQQPPMMGAPGGGQTPSPLSDSLNMNPQAGAPSKPEPAGPSGAGMPPPMSPAAPPPKSPGGFDVDPAKLPMGGSKIPLPQPRPQQRTPMPTPRPQMPMPKANPQQLQHILKFLAGPRDFRGQTYQPPWEAGLPESYKRQ